MLKQIADVLKHCCNPTTVHTFDVSAAFIPTYCRSSFAISQKNADFLRSSAMDWTLMSNSFSVMKMIPLLAYKLIAIQHSGLNLLWVHTTTSG